MTWRMMVPLAPRGWASSGDPFAALQRQMNRMFDDALGGVGDVAAAAGLRLDVREDDKAFHVTTDLPGLAEKDVEVTFHDGLLTIRGEKKIERDEKKDTWHIVERSTGSFSRQIGMPATIDAERIEAKFDKGVLTVTLPKLPDEKAAAKKIEVKTT